MRQKSLGLAKTNTKGGSDAGEVTKVVALDRSSDQEIILRFLGSTPTWGSAMKEIRLDFDLADQLQRLLADELETTYWTATV